MEAGRERGIPETTAAAAVQAMGGKESGSWMGGQGLEMIPLRVAHGLQLDSWSSLDKYICARLCTRKMKDDYPLFTVPISPALSLCYCLVLYHLYIMHSTDLT